MKVGDLVRPLKTSNISSIRGDLGVVVAVEMSQPSRATTYVRVFWTVAGKYVTYYWTRDYLEVISEISHCR